MTTISVVTVCLNAGRTLGDTLESVARQTHPLVEHLIIDGGSTDSTADVVARHGRRVARFVSERDGGLYDAMNKGARQATGDVIAFLNADDWYADPEALACVAAAFAAPIDMVYGDIQLVDSQPPFVLRRAWRDRQRVTSDFFRYGWQPAHPACFVRRRFFEQTGGFDTQWRIAADYDFLARTMLDGKLNMRHVPRTLVNMRTGGASTEGPRAILRANRECARALQTLGVRRPWTVITRKLLRKLAQLRVSRQRADLWRPWDDGMPAASVAEHVR